MKTTSIKLVLDNKPLSNGRHTIYLRIIKNRKKKNISLNLTCIKENFVNESFTKQHENYQLENELLLRYKSKAYEIIRVFQLNEKDFSLIDFESAFLGRDKSNFKVFEYWEDKINDMILSGRVGNARVLTETKKSFYKFCSNKDISFKEINVELLEKYVVFLKSVGNSDGGIGVKLRELRAIYNAAIKSGVVEETYYPFKIFKVSKYKGTGFKRALTREEVERIEKLDLSNYPNLEDSRRLFLFSYFTRGMNFYDIIKLKWEDVYDGKIEYIRSKTKGKFVIKILKPVEEILEYYGRFKNDSGYVFPLLNGKELTPTQILNTKIRKLKKFNNDIKAIAKLASIDKNVTSYVSRHSFATNLKHAGVSTDVISQSMGHQNIAITSAYLKEFEDDVIDDANKLLLREPKTNYKLQKELAEM